MTCCMRSFVSYPCLSEFCGFPFRWVTVQLLLANAIGASNGWIGSSTFPHFDVFGRIDQWPRGVCRRACRFRCVASYPYAYANGGADRQLRHREPELYRLEIAPRLFLAAGAALRRRGPGGRTRRGGVARGGGTRRWLPLRPRPAFRLRPV